MNQRTRKITLIISFVIFIIPEVVLLSSPVLIYFVPLIPLQIIQLYCSLIVGLAIFLVLYSFSWGRRYCGHLCPVTGFFTLLQLFEKDKTDISSDPWEFPEWYGNLMFALWVLAFAYLVIRNAGNSLGFMDYAEGFSNWPIISFYSLFLLSSILSRTFAKTDQAHYNCPIGPLMITSIRLSHRWKWKSLRFHIDKSSCTSCGICRINCISNRDLLAEMKLNAYLWETCVHCGSCLDNCPSGAIKQQWANSEMI